MRTRGQRVPVKTTKQIYKKLCGTLQTAPIDIFNHINNQELRLNNYALNDTQTKPISFIMPVSTTLSALTDVPLQYSSWLT